MKRLIPIVLIVCAGLLAACSSDIVYGRFVSIPSEEWHMDSVVRFDYSIVDTTTDYSIVVYVRHTERYPYQNIWLFAGDSSHCDTIGCYLADDRGRWLGDKQHGLLEMPVFIEEKVHFQDTGKYVMTIQHGMRDTVLRGVMDIGLEIKRYGQE